MLSLFTERWRLAALAWVAGAAACGGAEITFEVSPPPKDKKWFLFCLGEVWPLAVKEGQPVKGPDFEVSVQAGEKWK